MSTTRKPCRPLSSKGALTAAALSGINIGVIVVIVIAVIILGVILWKKWKIKGYFARNKMEKIMAQKDPDGKMLSDEELESIADKLGSEWLDLATELGLETYKRAQIIEWTTDPHERRRCVLKLWKHNRRDEKYKTKCKELYGILKGYRGDLAEEIRLKYPWVQTTSSTQISPTQASPTQTSPTQASPGQRGDQAEEIRQKYPDTADSPV